MKKPTPPTPRLRITRSTLRQLVSDELRGAIAGNVDPGGGIVTRGCTDSCAGNCAIDFTRLERNPEP